MEINKKGPIVLLTLPYFEMGQRNRIFVPTPENIQNVDVNNFMYTVYYFSVQSKIEVSVSDVASLQRKANG